MSKKLTFERWSKDTLHAIFLREGKVVDDIEVYSSSIVAAAAKGLNLLEEFSLPQDIAHEALTARGNNVVHVDFSRRTLEVT